MLLESLPLQTPDITQIISESTSDISNQVLSSLWTQFAPMVKLLGGVLVIYILYKIIAAINSYFLRKRIKRIDNNVQDLNKKVENILKIIGKKEDKHKKK